MTYARSARDTVSVRASAAEKLKDKTERLMNKTLRLKDKTLRLTDRLVDISFRDESISLYRAHNLMITTMLTDMVDIFR